MNFFNFSMFIHNNYNRETEIIMKMKCGKSKNLSEVEKLNCWNEGNIRFGRNNALPSIIIVLSFRRGGTARWSPIITFWCFRSVCGCRRVIKKGTPIRLCYCLIRLCCRWPTVGSPVVVVRRCSNGFACSTAPRITACASCRFCGWRTTPWAPTIIIRICSSVWFRITPRIRIRFAIITPTIIVVPSPRRSTAVSAVATTASATTLPSVIKLIIRLKNKN